MSQSAADQRWDNFCYVTEMMFERKGGLCDFTRIRAWGYSFTVHCARAAVVLKSILELASQRIWPANPLSFASRATLCRWIAATQTGKVFTNIMPEVSNTIASLCFGLCEKSLGFLDKTENGTVELAQKGKECFSPSTLHSLASFPLR